MSFRSTLILAVLAMPASVALADTSALSDPESLPKVPCTNFRYSAAFLKLYPRAPAACVEGRDLNGVKYAKFNARVFLNGPDFTTVSLLNVAGTPLSTFSFRASPNAQVAVNGTPKPISQLRPNDQITFWVPEGKLEAHSMPSPTDESWRVLPPQSSTTAPASNSQ
jgi:hypothetical protein